LKYNNGEVYSNEVAYDARILAMIPEALSDDAEAESAKFAEEVNNAKSQLLADKEAEIPEATPVYDAAISLNDLKSAITTFDVNNTDEVQTYEID
jgi:hypothetical protein